MILVHILKNFLLPQQLQTRINSINNLRYMSLEEGFALKSIIDNQECDAYTKSGYSKNVDAIRQ